MFASDSNFEENQKKLFPTTCRISKSKVQKQECQNGSKEKRTLSPLPESLSKISEFDYRMGRVERKDAYIRRKIGTLTLKGVPSRVGFAPFSSHFWFYRF